MRYIRLSAVLVLLACGDQPTAPASPPIVPVSISTTSLADGELGQPYNQTLAATGGTGAYAWSVTAGGLPAGLMLSQNGAISGTPTTVGTSNVTVTVTSGGAYNSRTLSISVIQVPASIELSDTVLKFSAQGDTASLSATVKDAAGIIISDAVVKWITSDSNVARVSSAGLITAVGNGTAVITANSDGTSSTGGEAPSPTNETPSPGDETPFNDFVRDDLIDDLTATTVNWGASDSTAAMNSSGGVITSPTNGTTTEASSAASAAAAITVTLVAESIELTDSALTFSSLGETIQLTVIAKDANDSTIVDPTVSWDTSDILIATISAEGLVTSVGNGSVTITATADAVSDTAAVTVAQVAASIELSDTVVRLFAVGDTTQLTATIKDANDSTIANLNTKVRWSWSGDRALERENTCADPCSTALYTAVAEGTMSIRARYRHGEGYRWYSTTAVVTVSPFAGSIELSQTVLTYSSLGNATQLTATVRDDTGRVLEGAPVTWVSSDESVAVVSSDGFVTSAGNGSATITATVDSVSAAAAATVAQVAASIELSHSSLVFWSLNNATQLTVTVRDANARPIPNPNTTVSWSTSDALIAAVSSTGLITSVANGSTTIAATSGTFSDAASVFVAECTVDTDGDRLPDCAETGTGVFLSQLDAGTDPNDTDTDDDGISDGDEVLGTTAGLDLPGLGLNPLVPSILIEHDWLDDSGHSHRPTAKQLDMMTASFAAQGIEVIHDYGQGSAPFNGGNLIPDADGTINGLGSEFHAYKKSYSDDNRKGYFHYNMVVHSGNCECGGMGELSGNDFIVATSWYGWRGGDTYDFWVADVTMHELGHNLGLHHGGNVYTNDKPNYNSLMNYRYSYEGVDNNCTPPADGVLDYSHGVNPDLDENNLDETRGICGRAPGWDWNGDGDELDVGITADINDDDKFEVLTDHDDWGNLDYDGVQIGSDGPVLASDPGTGEVITCPDMPVHLLPTNLGILR